MHCLVFPAGARVAAALFLAFLVAPAHAATSTAESPVVTVDLTGTPLLSSFTKTGTEDTPIAFAIGDFTASYIDPESGGLASIRIESLPTGGVLKLSGSPVSAGQVVPRVNISLLVYEPAANINGTRTFTVTASDGGLSSAPATVTLNIAAVADAPTLTTISTFSGTAEDASFSLSYATLLAASNAADTDGDAISFRIEAVSSGTLLKGSSGVLPGTTLVSAGETLVWTPVANAFGTLNAFTVKAWDGSSASTTAVQVKVEVAPTNDAPTLASVSPLTGASEDTPFTISYATLAAAATASDVDGDPLSFRIEAVHSGTLTKSGNAVVAGTTTLGAGESLVWTPASNANGQLAAFTVRAWDGTVASTNQAQIQVSVTALNDAPTLSSIVALNGAFEDTPFTLSYAALLAASNAADVDNPTVSFRLESLTSGTLTKGGVAAVPGTTLLSSGETWSWTPSANANGALSAFTVRAWDGTSSSAAPVAVVINVAAVSDAPTLATVGTLSGATEDVPFTVAHAALIAAADAADLEGDPISFRVEAISSGTLTKNGSPVTAGNTLLGVGETWVWTPPANANGTLNAFTVKAWDGTSPSATAVSVKVSVAPANDAPTLSSIATLSSATEDSPYTVSYAALAAAGNANDPDGDALSFRIAAVTAGTLTKGGVAVSPGSTVFGPGESVVWIPASNASGNLNAFTVVAWDGQMASSTPVQVVAAVAAVNDAPTLSAVNPVGSTAEDTPFTLTYATLAAAANAADAEGDVLSFRIESVLAGTLTKGGVPVAAGSTLLGAGETLLWTPPVNGNGQINAFSVRAWDGSAASASPVTVAVNVTPVNDAPVLTGFAPLSGASMDAGYVLSYAQLLAAAGVTDADGDAIAFRLEGVTTGTVIKGTSVAVAGSTLLRAGETWIWTPPSGVSGAVNAFSVKAWDGTVASATPAMVQIVVANVRILSQPRSQSLATGSASSVSVTTSGSGLTYQWYKDGAVLAGATSPSYTIASFGGAQAGTYAVSVTGSGVTLRSADAQLSVLPDGVQASHAQVGSGYVSSGTVTITNTLSFPSALTSLGWSVLLPPGWSFVSDAGTAGETRPAVGATDLLEWAWTTVPASPITFTYTVNVPATESGTKSLASLAIVRGLPGTTAAQQMLATPDPLNVAHLAYHDADTTRDFRIGLLELTRVIEFYNTRIGTLRTGAYSVATTTTEDGFAPDAARSSSMVYSLIRYHSADTNQDGKVSLLELTRVIELYNFRVSGARTGQYRIASGTEDGFAPGP